MSRSGYSDDCENLAMWRGQVASAIRGKRGQKMLIDLAAAMDAMPVKELITGRLEAQGAYCALGAVGAARGVDLSKVDLPEGEDYFEPDGIANALDIAHQLAQEVMYINDESGGSHKQIDGKWRYVPETPAERWVRVRKWVGEQITKPPTPTPEPERTR